MKTQYSVLKLKTKSDGFPALSNMQQIKSLLGLIGKVLSPAMINAAH